MELKYQVMLDLETLGNGSNAMIISIGACDFTLKKKFYAIIDPARSNGDIDPSTVSWWMQQSDASRYQFKNAHRSWPLHQALVNFKEWLESLGGMSYIGVWGNGPAFDNVILANAYKRIGMELPWMFWNDRCFRTLKALNPKVKPPVRKGVAHNSLDDAVYQATYAAKILKANARKK